jgi:hypothetical protein
MTVPNLSQPLAGFCLALSLAASVFADEPPPSEATEATRAEPTETRAEPTSAAETETPAAPAETASEAPLAAKAATQPAQVADDPIVCKRVEMTGTRLRKGKVCKPASEWRAMSDDAQSMMKDHDRKSSPGPGGQTLPPGG